MLWYQRWSDTPLDTLYALGEPGMTQETVAELLAEDLEQMGATLGRVVDVRRWRYFPHVRPTAMAAGDPCLARNWKRVAARSRLEA